MFSLPVQPRKLRATCNMVQWYGWSRDTPKINETSKAPRAPTSLVPTSPAYRPETSRCHDISFDPIGSGTTGTTGTTPPCPMSPMIAELSLCFCISSLSMSDCQIMIHFVDVCGLSANSGVKNIFYGSSNLSGSNFSDSNFHGFVKSRFSARLDRSAGHFLTNLKACGRDPDRGI